MATKSEKSVRFEEIKRIMPLGTRSILVLDDRTGLKKYKHLDKLSEDDIVQFKADGVTPIVTKKSPKVARVTIEPVTPMAAELVKQKGVALKIDPILAIAKANPESPDILSQIVLELGDEAASIKFERKQAEIRGEKTSELSMRRINSLKAMGDMWLKRREQIVSRGIDMNSPAYRIFMKEVLSAFQESLVKSGARPEMVETVFSKLSKIMNESWEFDVRHKIQNVI